MTYSKVYVFEWDEGTFKRTNTTYQFDYLTQKEGIAVDEKFIYISEENEEKLSEAAFLYRVKR
jgi:hypothetical protein